MSFKANYSTKRSSVSDSYQTHDTWNVRQENSSKNTANHFQKPVSENKQNSDQKRINNEALRDLSKHLSDLARLIANVTESYTTCIFLKDPNSNILHVGGVQTLSRDFLYDAKINFNSGLVGWVAENKAPICVSPFEHDSTTLLIYSCDQQLKSFVAVPILDERQKLIGVISCDSKKSYAFAKITEKILSEFCQQALTILRLHQELVNIPAERSPLLPNNLPAIYEELRNIDNEDDLLNHICKISQTQLERDALMVVTSARGGVGKGAYYTTSEGQTEHRLLEMVKQHQKVLCPDRSVQALVRSDPQRRSFLSVPLRVLGKEAGSINLLSRANQSFDGEQIRFLEKVAKEVCNSLERIRLKQKFSRSTEDSSLLSWQQFSIKADTLLDDAKRGRVTLSLVRLVQENTSEIESAVGVEDSIKILNHLHRLVEQVILRSAIACNIREDCLLILCDSSHVKKIVTRIQHLVERLNISGIIGHRQNSQLNIGKVLISGMKLAVANYPKQGETLDELILKTLNIINESKEVGSKYASRWI